MSKNRNTTFYNRINWLAIVTIYLVILAGGIVRGSGSGMGCPDWPKCFGEWIPPTAEEELPEGYREFYLQKRIEKNQRLAKVASKLGFLEFANQLEHDDSIKEETAFDVVHCWIEYINRLLGMFSGIFILLAALLAPFVGMKQKHKIWAIVALVLVVLQGFLGAFVVSTNLIPFLISLHFVLAMAVVAALLLASNTINVPLKFANGKVRRIAIMALLILLVQMILGSRVRELIDAFNIDQLVGAEPTYLVLMIHKNIALVLFGLLGMLYWLSRKGMEGLNKRFTLSLLILVIVQVVCGLILEQIGLLGAVQTLHVFGSTILFGLLFTLILKNKLGKEIALA